ncbi:L-threonylcarbamoyladenylate synthase [Halochromatium glycolicum]|jgi:tRNA threonylcarbamoyl adenosine modification protein (Sua5/YciO/YrdC/YwlC family)|uniref:Threonylcarbamoyl-AMP synthase n=1 Tax=Halochromatium glycolicum TaxID=85075 RepID=A0AAJ0U892_9GAMM|nr:L-threonylcarbamoyladenylate synthase [Halochromatium glycolicum]MBK1707023.1 threonylcarbamoyl-AMP synthase [Halochromatium glycolicum]
MASTPHFLEIHPKDPQPRLIARAASVFESGGVVVYPTDSSYALGCQLGEKSALDRIRMIRRVDDKHNFTLVCRDLSEIATYARLDNQAYRQLKSLTPGPYTFIFQATKQVPRRLLHPKRRAIGIRVPGTPITQALLAELDQPILSTTLIMPGDEEPMDDVLEIRETIGHCVDLVIDGGPCGQMPTTVVDMTQEPPAVVREGKGDTSVFQH